MWESWRECEGGGFIMGMIEVKDRECFFFTSLFTIWRDSDNSNFPRGEWVVVRRSWKLDHWLEGLWDAFGGCERWGFGL